MAEKPQKNVKELCYKDWLNKEKKCFKNWKNIKRKREARMEGLESLVSVAKNCMSQFPVGKSRLC